jgi:ABC-2 type transport system ATP-binding protein
MPLLFAQHAAACLIGHPLRPGPGPGLTAPIQGRIELFGESGEGALRKARRKIGSIVETPALFPGMTARQNLETQARLLGLSEPDIISSTLYRP